MSSTNRPFRVVATIEKHVGDEYAWHEVLFDRASLERWCAGLSLLSCNLVDRLKLVTKHGVSEVIVQIDPELDRRARVAGSPDEMQLHISPTEFEYWLSFFLLYWRDGATPVDHIDVEADGTAIGVDTYNFVLRTPVYAQPVGQVDDPHVRCTFDNETTTEIKRLRGM